MQREMPWHRGDTGVTDHRWTTAVGKREPNRDMNGNSGRDARTGQSHRATRQKEVVIARRNDEWTVRLDHPAFDVVGDVKRIRWLAGGSCKVGCDLTASLSPRRAYRRASITATESAPAPETVAHPRHPGRGAGA